MSTKPFIPSIILNALTIPASAKQIKKIEKNLNSKKGSKNAMSTPYASVPRNWYAISAEGITVSKRTVWSITILKSSIKPKTKTGAAHINAVLKKL